MPELTRGKHKQASIPQRGAGPGRNRRGRFCVDQPSFAQPWDSVLTARVLEVKNLRAVDYAAIVRT